MVYGLVVVVENDEKVGLASAGIVQSLIGETAGKGAVTDHRYALAVEPPDSGSFGITQGCTYRGRGVSYAEGVIFAFAHFRETAQSPAAAQGLECFAPAGQNLMGIGLMAHIEDELVLRSVIDIMQRRNQLHRAETGPEMPRVFRAHLYHIRTELTAELRELGDLEFPQIFGRIDIVEQLFHQEC